MPRRYGYGATFLITAALQLVGVLTYLVLLPVVPAEARATPPSTPDNAHGPDKDPLMDGANSDDDLFPPQATTATDATV